MTKISAAEIATLAEALGFEAQGVENIRDLEAVIGAPAESTAYLVLGVVTATIPSDDEVRSFAREWRASSLSSVMASVPRRLRRRARRSRVRLGRGVVVDVTDTARTLFTTGIQRVVRETLSRWMHNTDLDLVVWDSSRRTFLGANAVESERATLHTGSPRKPDIVIPFRTSLFLPEIAVDVARATALHSIAVHSASSTLAIGFDCIPVTTAETAGPGMPGAFSRYLSTLARFEVVAPISEAAGTEFRGWRSMLAGAGLAGPDITVVSLPTNVANESTSRASEVRADLSLGDAPIVLGVGSREPRKNHLNLLHACELNWQAGHEFTLVLVGGNAWETRRVDTLISDLQQRGRSIVSVAGVDDVVLRELYTLSRFTVFCSLNEGFGLPIVESLSRGTPVLTSDFGSMRHLGDGNGAGFVDPHSPRAMAASIERLLNDDELLAQLAAQTRSADQKTWDDYAQEIRGLMPRADTMKAPE